MMCWSQNIYIFRKPKILGLLPYEDANCVMTIYIEFRLPT
jgi:hypothetical protein